MSSGEYRQEYTLRRPRQKRLNNGIKLSWDYCFAVVANTAATVNIKGSHCIPLALCITFAIETTVAVNITTEYGRLPVCTEVSRGMRGVERWNIWHMGELVIEYAHTGVEICRLQCWPGQRCVLLKSASCFHGLTIVLSDTSEKLRWTGRHSERDIHGANMGRRLEVRRLLRMQSPIFEARKRKDVHAAVHSTHWPGSPSHWRRNSGSEKGIATQTCYAQMQRQMMVGDQHVLYTHDTGSLDDDESWVRSVHCE